MKLIINNVPDTEEKALREWYAQTYPVHRLTWGAWLLGILSRARTTHDRSQAKASAK